MTAAKLSPALRRVLDFIGTDDRGCMELQLVASGGRVPSQLRTLILDGYVERCEELTARGQIHERVRLTAAGRAACRK
jgi:hypothetical protein